MDVEKLITHLRYGTTYHGDVQRDTLDALERLGEVEALQEEAASLPTLDEAIELVAELPSIQDEDDFLATIDDIGEQLCAVRDAIEELRGVA